MRAVRIGTVLAVMVSAVWLRPAVVDSQTVGERFWPQWRGHDATGVSRHADPPIEWKRDEERPMEG